MFKIKSITNLRNFKIIVLLLATAISTVFIYTKINENPVLEINVNQEDFLITITGENKNYTSESDFKSKVDKGLYTIKVEKDDYITEQRQLNILENTKIEINLFKSSLSDLQKSYQLEPIRQVSTTESVDNNNSYGINRENGNLIKIEDGKEKIVYSGKTKDYAIGKNILIVLDQEDQNQIIVIDSSTLKTRRISKKELYPITSIALSDDEKFIYFLAEFNIRNKISNLYTTEIDGSNTIKITGTTAQSVKYLKNSIVVLFEENHDLNKNRIILFDTNKKEEILYKYTNKFSISPNKIYISLHKTNNIELLNTDNYKSNSSKILDSSRSTWRDSNTLYIFRNNEENVYLSKVTANPFKVEDFSLLLEGISLQNIIGFMGDKIYLQDYENKIFSIKL